MKVRSSIFLFLVLWGLCLRVGAATFTIGIQGSAFVPGNQTIQVGDTVTWMNNDSIPHTSTSGQPSAPDGKWDSGFLSAGQSFSHTFTAAGTFPYYCTVHPFMTASITVQAAGPTPPTVTITNPTNNTTMAAPGNILIEATATPSGGTITQVEFFDGAQSLGIDASSPYSVTANLAAGTHSLTAKATDSNGAVGTSAAVIVTAGGGGTKIDNPIPQAIAKGNITIELETVLSGLVSPLGLAAPDDGSGRLFVYDQIGLLHVVTNGVMFPTPLLDVRSRLVALNPNYDERGLLGVATHSNFAQHPLVYTYTSEPNGPMADFMIMYDGGITNNCQSVIAEWRVDANDPNKLDPASRRELMRIDKPQSNHNGGVMRFGPDGLLYFSIGDGGAADDQGDGHLPEGNAQNKTRILGKVVRIDVDGRNSANGQYGIPTDNPFVSEAGAVKEIYAYGLRNPYSFSFDRQTGDLWLADVGQNNVEEVDRITKGGNFGWRIKEGTFYFDPNGTNNGFVTTQPVRDVPAGLIDPIAEYDHDEGEAVIGGFVYRGPRSDLTGKYVTGDWGRFEAPSGRLFYLDGTELKELRIGTSDRPFGNWLKGWGEDQAGNLYAFGSTNLGPSGTSGKMFKIVPTSVNASNTFLVKNLVSDIPGLAPVLDTNLVNPWGIAFGPTTFFWISDNHTGVSTLYDSTGGVQSLVVTIPAPTGSTGPSAPTGVVFNNTSDFALSGTPARFIFVTEDGTLAAWASGTNAVIKADNSGPGAIYKGVAIANSHGTNRLYAADFHNAKIDVFDTIFQQVTMSGFVDPTIPAGFAPFNIRNIGGNLYVTYAKQDADAEDEIPGPGNGYVNIFDADGNLLRRFASGGNLNSPWGLANAPATFGAFGGALLVGNFGDGRINAFDPGTGASLGQLNDQRGNPISILGLWDLSFGNGTKAGEIDDLYFTAGIPGGGAIEDHGLFGEISYEKSFLITQVARNGNTLTISWAGGVPPYVLQKKSDLNTATWTDVGTVTGSSTNVTIEGTAGFFRVSTNANP
jgi:uncharacterized protein (TIGR03118 family)